MKHSALLSIIAVGLLAAGMAWSQSKPVLPQSIASVDPAGIAEGRELYARFCASCHGANLEGQPDWQSPGADGLLPAPPHDGTGHTWHHDDRLLFDYTKLGGKAALEARGVRFNSGMPGFADDLSDAEIWRVLGFIRSNWSEREQRVQAERTRADAATRGH
ncbi:MAG: cytochrome c [Rhodobacteraceae bacterium]|nr:cytochrome c [Paracoccaceae bacterium]